MSDQSLGAPSGCPTASLASPLDAACDMVAKIAETRNSISWMRDQVGHLGIRNIEDIAELRMIALSWMTAAAAEVARSVRHASSTTEAAQDRADVLIGSPAELEQAAALFPGRIPIRVGDQVRVPWRTALILGPMDGRLGSWWLEQAAAIGFPNRPGFAGVLLYEPTPPAEGMQPTEIVIVFDVQDLDMAALENPDDWVTLWGGELPERPLEKITLYGSAADTAQHAWVTALLDCASPEVELRRRSTATQAADEPGPAGEVTVIWRLADYRAYLDGDFAVRGEGVLWGFHLTGRYFAKACMLGRPETAEQHRWLRDVLQPRVVPPSDIELLERQDNSAGSTGSAVTG